MVLHATQCHLGGGNSAKGVGKGSGVVATSERAT